VDATRLQSLAMQVGELKTANEVLDAELAGARQGQRDAEAQLHAANDRIRKLEAELQANAAVLASLQQNIHRLGRDESGSRPALRAAAPENPKRVLIRQEGNAEVVHPIGRRTSIGRTQENDIQIDTVHVSRRHAVLLSNSDHCIVEDLNSTNGVLVNGRRIGRQLLQDGDIVMVGKTEFRYQQRP
jgi:pSer/pThr/pTyr-binding forkhead associated (FHA) protein